MILITGWLEFAEQCGMDRSVGLIGYLLKSCQSGGANSKRGRMFPCI